MNRCWLGKKNKKTLYNPIALYMLCVASASGLKNIDAHNFTINNIINFTESFVDVVHGGFIVVILHKKKESYIHI